MTMLYCVLPKDWRYANAQSRAFHPSVEQGFSDVILYSASLKVRVISCLLECYFLMRWAKVKVTFIGGDRYGQADFIHKAYEFLQAPRVLIKSSDFVVIGLSRSNAIFFTLHYFFFEISKCIAKYYVSYIFLIKY